MVINETQYSQTSVKKQMIENNKKIKELLKDCDAPEAKEALKLINYNEKLANRKGYFDLSSEETAKKARRQNEHTDYELNQYSPDAKSFAKKLTNEYGNKEYKDKYGTTIKIDKITTELGYLTVRGETERSNGIVRELSYRELKPFDELKKLANYVEKWNTRQDKKVEDNKSDFKRKYDDSDEAREKDFNY